MDSGPGRPGDDDAHRTRPHEAVNGSAVAHDQDELMRALHDEHARALWGYCLRLVEHDHARAHDITQETLLRAWQHPEVLGRTPDHVRGWLFTVARNIVIDEWRHRRIRPETLTDELPERGGDQDQVDTLLQTWVVGEAMARLSEDHREVLRECYLQGRSVADAARRLGIPRAR
ncbi:sigma-70 family RNA polymerase sigma factor [Phycicoccus sp. HDW14]|uniref:sigma-70 family RNA polymerase sigma factor n=1 Tax=Phycicoccus sp. HDW14 TaxID=2714941 RepID=UPI00352FFC13